MEQFHSNQSSGNANILIKDCAVAQLARTREPFLGIVNQKQTTASTNRRQAQEPPPVDKERLRRMRVNGTHVNNQELFFDMEKEDETGRTLITVPPMQSKFGGAIAKAGGKETKKQYSVCKMDDRELDRAMSDATRNEIRQLK